jgi:hypothetical protein
MWSGSGPKLIVETRMLAGSGVAHDSDMDCSGVQTVVFEHIGLRGS